MTTNLTIDKAGDAGNHAGPATRPGSATSPATGEDEPRGIDRWWANFGLAVAAILAWVFLILAFVVDRWTAAPHELVVAMYVASYLAGGTIATRTAIEDLFQRRVNIDLLMVTAAAGAALLNAWAEGAVLLALFSTSNALEYYALRRTRNAVRALMDLSPSEASVVRDDVEQVVPVSALEVGDVIVVRPGEKIPADAALVAGTTEVDQAAITGESMPVVKTVGDDVFAGTVNQSGAFRARVLHLSTETTIARIVRMVEEAQSRKSRAERFTDSFEGPYAIGVIVFAALVGIVAALLGTGAGDAFYRAMTVLVVASPCALVISTPAATLSAIANAARNGVLVKGGSYLDELGVVDIVAFDKTGTLTVGRPSLTDLVPVGVWPADEILNRVASVEHLSEHPIATAIVTAAGERGLNLRSATDFTADPGRGVTANLETGFVAAGNEALFALRGIHVPPAAIEAAERIRSEGRTAILVGDEQGVYGVVGVADQLRPGVREAIAALKRQGVKRIVMLTGDNVRVGNAIAHQVGIDEVFADMQPEHKLDVIERLRKEGRVAMVGDGVNDAPALATADLGVAMGSGGTDVALETADVVLITGDIGRLPFAVGLSRRMRTIIRICIGFSLSVIAVLVTLALTVGIPLPVGVVGHEGSTIIVVLTGLTLLAYRGTKPTMRQEDRQPEPQTTRDPIAA